MNEQQKMHGIPTEKVQKIKTLINHGQKELSSDESFWLDQDWLVMKRLMVMKKMKKRRWWEIQIKQRRRNQSKTRTGLHHHLYSWISILYPRMIVIIKYSFIIPQVSHSSLNLHLTTLSPSQSAPHYSSLSDFHASSSLHFSSSSALLILIM